MIQFALWLVYWWDHWHTTIWLNELVLTCRVGLVLWGFGSWCRRWEQVEFGEVILIILVLSFLFFEKLSQFIFLLFVRVLLNFLTFILIRLLFNKIALSDSLAS